MGSQVRILPSVFNFKGLLLKQPFLFPNHSQSSQIKDTHKTCSRCKRIKPLEEFNFRNRARNSRHSYCKECGKLYTQEHYKKSKEQYLGRNLRSYAKRRQIVLAAKQKACVDGGVEYPYYVMDFDRRGEETKSFSLYKIQNYTEKMILREIAKCDVVCANCHREQTYQRRVKKASQI